MVAAALSAAGMAGLSEELAKRSPFKESIFTALLSGKNLGIDSQETLLKVLDVCCEDTVLFGLLQASERPLHMSAVTLEANEAMEGDVCKVRMASLPETIRSKIVFKSRAKSVIRDFVTQKLAKKGPLNMTVQNDQLPRWIDEVKRLITDQSLAEERDDRRLSNYQHVLVQLQNRQEAIARAQEISCEQPMDILSDHSTDEMPTLSAHPVAIAQPSPQKGILQTIGGWLPKKVLSWFGTKTTSAS